MAFWGGNRYNVYVGELVPVYCEGIMATALGWAKGATDFWQLVVPRGREEYLPLWANRIERQGAWSSCGPTPTPSLSGCLGTIDLPRHCHDLGCDVLLRSGFCPIATRWNMVTTYSYFLDWWVFGAHSVDRCYRRFVVAHYRNRGVLWEILYGELDCYQLQLIYVELGLCGCPDPAENAIGWRACSPAGGRGVRVHRHCGGRNSNWGGGLEELWRRAFARALTKRAGSGLSFCPGCEMIIDVGSVSRAINNLPRCDICAADAILPRRLSNRRQEVLRCWMSDSALSAMLVK